MMGETARGGAPTPTPSNHRVRPPTPKQPRSTDAKEAERTIAKLKMEKRKLEEQLRTDQKKRWINSAGGTPGRPRSLQWIIMAKALPKRKEQPPQKQRLLH